MAPISMRNRAQFTTLLLHFSLYFSWASLPRSPFHIYHTGRARDLVMMDSMGSAEPINFKRRILQPINFLETHILTLNGPKLDSFQSPEKASNPSIQIPNEAPAGLRC